MIFFFYALIATNFVNGLHPDWVPVPNGLLYHISCIKTVSSETVIDLEALNNETSCKYAPKEDPRRQFYPIQANYQPSGGVITQMNTTFSVPGLPTARGGATVYLWPGFKGEKPVIGYPVLQPVLEWHGSSSWILRSWLVGVQAAVKTEPITVSSGDIIPTYISLQNNEWTVYGKDDKTGQTAVLHVTKQRAGGDYNWGVQVMETIVPAGECNYYPASGIKFSGISVNNDQSPISMVCQVNDHTCNQNCSIDKGSVTFTWKN